MAGNVPTPAEPGFPGRAEPAGSAGRLEGALIGDIVEDAHALLNQQLLLFKAEVRQDLVKAKAAALFVLAGTAVSFLAVILLSLMLVHLVQWAATGAPPWVGYAVVGVLLVGVGGALAYWTVSRLKTTLNPLPVQAVEGLKENVEWKTAPR
jgi:uncharacterized membrane protein YqjE